PLWPTTTPHSRGWQSMPGTATLRVDTRCTPKAPRTRPGCAGFRSPIRTARSLSPRSSPAATPEGGRTSTSRSTPTSTRSPTPRTRSPPPRWILTRMRAMPCSNSTPMTDRRRTSRPSPSMTTMSSAMTAVSTSSRRSAAIPAPDTWARQLFPATRTPPRPAATRAGHRGRLDQVREVARGAGALLATLDPALPGYHGRVDLVDGLLEAAAQSTLQRGEGEKAGVVLGELAVMGELEPLDGPAGEL